MKLRRELSLHLVRSKVGRIVLHLVCLSVDHHLLWHLKGIRREFCH